MKYSEAIVEKMSSQIEEWKVLYKYDNYVDTIVSFVNALGTEGLYDFLTFDNIGEFLTESLREKLFIDASSRNLIETKFSKKRETLLI